MYASCDLHGQRVSSDRHSRRCGGQLNILSRCGPCADLTRLEDDICKAAFAVELERLIGQALEGTSELEIKRLISQRHTLKSKVNEVHDSLTTNLPPELISRIFVFAIPEDCFFAGSSSRHAQRSSSMLVGSVCRAWRKLAWSTPQLWSCLRLYLSPEDVPYQVEKVTEWVARAGCLTLSIQINISHQYVKSSRSFAHIIPILRVINQVSDRWRDLDVRIPSVFIFQLRGEARMLENLRLETSLEHQFPSDHRFNLSNKPPAPTVVEIRGLSFGGISLDWRRVNRADLGTALSLDECLRLFQQAPRMRICNIGRVVDREIAPAPSGHIVHENLQSLAICLSRITSRLLLERLSFPALEEVVYLEGAVEVLDALIRRSSCRLTKLVIDVPVVTQIGLLQLLRATPDLKSLTLLRFRIKGGFLSFLCSTSLKTEECSNLNFLPCLQDLSISGTRHFSWNTIPRLFPSPHNVDNHVCRPLRSLKLLIEEAYADLIDGEVLRQLRAIINTGVDLSICDGAGGFDLITESEK